MNLEKVTREGLSVIWPPLEIMLKEAPLLWGGWTLEQIKGAIFSGGLQLWLLLDDERRVHMAMMTQLVFYSEGVALRIVWAMGEDVKNGIPRIEELEQVASWAKCRWVEILGRRGWERPLRRFGYKVEFALLRKDVGGEAFGSRSDPNEAPPTGSIH